MALTLVLAVKPMILFKDTRLSSFFFVLMDFSFWFVTINLG